MFAISAKKKCQYFFGAATCQHEPFILLDLPSLLTSKSVAFSVDENRCNSPPFLMFALS
jgi:hypothetical protein